MCKSRAAYYSRLEHFTRHKSAQKKPTFKLDNHENDSNSDSFRNCWVHIEIVGKKGSNPHCGWKHFFYSSSVSPSNNYFSGFQNPRFSTFSIIDMRQIRTGIVTRTVQS